MSRFVSGGTNDEPTERDAEWLRAQEEIEAKHREKAKLAEQQGGKSLYETLEANKAAKQEQFEESTRLRNQFRSLDEDEVEFLDSVLETTRAKEEAVRKATSEQLDAFRKQQEEAEKAARQAEATDAPDAAQTTWSVGPRKRKKGREDVLGGVKLRRTSTAGKEGKEDAPADGEASSSSTKKDALQHSTVKPEQKVALATPNDGKDKSISANSPPVQPSPASALGLGLAAYSSGEDN